MTRPKKRKVHPGQAQLSLWLDAALLARLRALSGTGTLRQREIVTVALGAYLDAAEAAVSLKEPAQH